MHARPLTAGGEIPPDQLAWLERTQTRLGRPLRVLHVGNIANNAYINAKLMRRLGIEADVLCADYYHVMGCPEWEEVPVTGDFGDENAPDWWKAGIRGFKRPAWFVQGPRILCLAYLAALADRKVVKAEVVKQALSFHRWARARQTPVARLAHKVIKWAQIFAYAVNVALCYFRAPFSVSCDLIRERLGGAKTKTASTPAAPALRTEDIGPYKSSLSNRNWRRLLSHYDIIQGYATEGLFPLASGFARYTAYEHGTIRDIPFQDDAQGRICTAVFQNALAVFITNTDCVAAADRLGVSKERQYPIPHAFDSDRTFQFFDQWRPKLAVKRDPPTFIAPARQHWNEGYATWRKGNDVIVRAAHLLADQGVDFRVTFVAWGKEVDLTRQLIKELDVEKYFTWVQPMDKLTLWRTYLQCVGVIDQFVMKAIGSVTFEAMAMGRPVLTALDEAVVGPFFGAMPPLCNVHEPKQLADAMLKIVIDPDWSEALGSKAQGWIRHYHSSERILSIHLAAYNALFETKL